MHYWLSLKVLQYAFSSWNWRRSVLVKFFRGYLAIWFPKLRKSLGCTPIFTPACPMLTRVCLCILTGQYPKSQQLSFSARNFRFKNQWSLISGWASEHLHARLVHTHSLQILTLAKNNSWNDHEHHCTTIVSENNLLQTPHFCQKLSNMIGLSTESLLIAVMISARSCHWNCWEELACCTAISKKLRTLEGFTIHGNLRYPPKATPPQEIRV